MPKLQSNFHFKTIAFLYKFRDLFLPRKRILNEVGIQPGFHVLDYGCEPGSYLTSLAELVGKSGKIYALDVHLLAIQMVQKAASQKRLENVETILSDCKTGLSNGSVDVILLYDTFHDLSSPKGVFEELHRILKPNGILSFSDHHMKENEIVSRVTKGGLFKMLRKDKRTYSSDIREKLKRENDENGLIQQMRNDIERLRSEAMSREESLSELEKLLLNKKEMLAHTPSIWPAVGWVTSDFGFRINPFTGLTQMHEGIDISNRVGTPVIAPADGVISDSGNDLGLGKILVISHGFGMITRYAHLNKVSVKLGQKVKRGEKIAEIGMSGKTTGPHLHYEVRINGIPANPMRYILN